MLWQTSFLKRWGRGGPGDSAAPAQPRPAGCVLVAFISGGCAYSTLEPNSQQAHIGSRVPTHGKEGSATAAENFIFEEVKARGTW